jgi:hypothetical protein
MIIKNGMVRSLFQGTALKEIESDYFPLSKGKGKVVPVPKHHAKKTY